MSRLAHGIYLGVLALITALTTLYLAYAGYAYYRLPMSERYYHPQYEWFKASGFFGHGLGIVGTLLILIGVVLYITAKKYGYLERIIRLKYLLEFHIFLCTLGPILVLFHTAFKFGGVISIGFWSMALVVLSGVIGRYIYIQIPRTISGRELSLKEIHDSQYGKLVDLVEGGSISQSVLDKVKDYHNPYPWGYRSIRYRQRQMNVILSALKAEAVAAVIRRTVMRSVRAEIAMKMRIRRLAKMQQLFKYWHVAHKPFAIIMLVVVAVHVIVTIGLGYRWII